MDEFKSLHGEHHHNKMAKVTTDPQTVTPGRGGGERGWNHALEKRQATELLTNRFFTDEAIYHRCAGVGFQAGHCGPLQVSTEPRVVWFARKPLQCGVRECRHVFPSPVGDIDLAQAYPR